jgi:chromatin segregation and condensation protein Rec8/ScpA/Scc1 (kleisin family)
MNYCVDEMYGMYLNVTHINKSRDFDDTADAILRYIRKNQNSVYELSVDEIVDEIKRYIATLPGKKE